MRNILDTFLRNKSVDDELRTEILKNIFNILHIDTEINILNNLQNNNEELEKKYEKDLVDLSKTDNLLGLYNKKVVHLTNKYDKEMDLVEKLNNNEELKDFELRKIRKMLEEAEIKKTYTDKYDKLYDASSKLSLIESDLNKNIDNKTHQDMNLNKKTLELQTSYDQNISDINKEDEELKKTLDQKYEELKNIRNDDDKKKLKLDIEKLQSEKKLLLDKLNEKIVSEQKDYTSLLNKSDDISSSVKLNKKQNELFEKTQKELDKQKMDLLREKILLDQKDKKIESENENLKKLLQEEKSKKNESSEINKNLKKQNDEMLKKLQEKQSIIDNNVKKINLFTK